MKMLFVYPNVAGYTRIPVGLAGLIACLKKANHKVKVFDLTFYDIHMEKNDDFIRARFLNYKNVDLSPYGVKYQKASFEQIIDDLNALIGDYKPDLIGFSVTEDTYLTALKIARAIKKCFDVKIIFGGIQASMASDEIIREKEVDFVCVGEGEEALVEMADRIEDGGRLDNIRNIWSKTLNGIVCRNEIRPLTNLDELPYPDLSDFSPMHFYRPLANRVFRMSMLEMTRGCPRRCSYCNNHALQELYKGKGHYIRRKSIGKFIQEAKHLKETYDLNCFFLVDDDFLLLKERELEELAAEYKRIINIPFIAQIEPSSVTERKAELLVEMGCITVLMSIESGSEYIRTQVFNRHISNKAMIRGFNILRNHHIRVSGACIIGNPHEKRSHIFETIEMYRKCKPTSVTTAFLMPFKGTKIWDLCVKEGYYDAKIIRDVTISWQPVLNLPQISKEELIGLMRTIPLYAKLPRALFPLIKICERDNTLLSMFLFFLMEKLFWWVSDREVKIIEKYGHLSKGLSPT